VATKQCQCCGVDRGFVAVGISLTQISNGRRYDFRSSYGSGLAAVHVRVHGQIIVGLQARQIRVANACVFHEIIDTAGERYVDSPSTRGILMALFGWSCSTLYR